MAQIDNIKFRLNSTYDGTGQYIIYNNIDCDGDIVISGSTTISGGTSLVTINQPLILNDDISIKFTDIKGCEICENYNIITAVCTPFTGSVIIIEIPQETVVTAIRLQSSGTDCSNGNSTDPFVTYAYIVADYPDLVLNNNILVLNNTTGLGFGGIETQLYNPNDNDVSISNNSIASDLANFILGSFNDTFLINQASLLNTNSPNISSSTNSSGTIQFELCVSDPHSGDSGTE